MPLPDAVRRVAEIAKGKGVRVIGPDGEHRILSSAEEEITPDTVAEMAQRLVDLDSQIRATVAVVSIIAAKSAELTERLEATLSAFEATTEAQVKLSQGVERLAVIMAQPTEPVYNAKGILIGARRVDKLKEVAK